MTRSSLKRLRNSSSICSIPLLRVSIEIDTMPASFANCNNLLIRARVVPSLFAVSS